MESVFAFLVVTIVSIILVPFLSSKWKGIVAVLTVGVNACISGMPAIHSLGGSLVEYTLSGSSVTGEIPVRIDALSGWFVLIINITFVTGALYGFFYMKTYKLQRSNLSIHCIAYILAHATLLAICVLQNSLVFLFTWEIMALASFLLIIFEHHKQETIRSGINFLVQAHVCILLLMLGFIWVASYTSSYDFRAITEFTSSHGATTGVVLFTCFFFGFAIKAGFVPFHTWLPYAHPAAPSHVSGVMSGVIIKIGVYGILRMLLLIKGDFITIGYIILFFSAVSGIYGVMLAILQHNLKKLLAYHSIENIGIIGIGIGIGCIGIGNGNSALVIISFSGALLHTLNHSLFKSILFYCAGNVYQATHTMNIEHLGGLIRKMPQTAILFLIAALAICGLPPFNGFISEFLIYYGMFSGLQGAGIIFLSSLVFSIFGLVLIGGLAMLCFTKAFGTVFLGVPRHHLNHVPVEAGWGKLIPIYAGTLLIVAIGIFPRDFVIALAAPVSLFYSGFNMVQAPFGVPALSALTTIGYAALGFIGLSALVYVVRTWIMMKRPQRFDATWGCGYVAPNNKMQYTASSFVRTYRKLAAPVLLVHKRKQSIKGIFPKGGWHETHPYDKAEEWLIDYPLRQIRHLFNRFIFLQNGNPQFYILYGVGFIILIFGIPFIYQSLLTFIRFLNTI